MGAGTVEFIANQDGSFYFMEMNTRLQVEHPVTEMITGTDLVEWQLRVAAGEPLPKQQHELAINGHAIEARIYAENPEKGFLPSIGTLRHLATPDAVSFELGGAVSVPAGVRIDSGVRAGDAISPFYDPMIAKLIVWGADRKQALARMAQALSEYQVVGLATNIAFLKRLVEGQAFSTADLDTGLIERNQDALFPAPQAAPKAALALAVVSLIAAEKQSAAAQSRTNPADPWGKALCFSAAISDTTARASAAFGAACGAGNSASWLRSIRPVSRSAVEKAWPSTRRLRKAMLVARPTTWYSDSACAMRASACLRSAPQTINLAIIGS